MRNCCHPGLGRRVWVLGTRHVKQTGDISSVRNDPALPTAYHSTGSEAEEAIADRNCNS